jgi:hypothetical protein
MPKTHGARSAAAWTSLVAVSVLAAASAGVGLGVAVGRGHDAGVGDVRLVDSVETACQSWIAERMPTGVDGSWCRDMGEWMRQAGPVGMMGWSTWGRADDLRARCSQWAADNGPDDHMSWCDEMLDWMQDHMVAAPRG